MLRMGYDATRYDLALVQDWAEIYAGCMRALAAHAGSPCSAPARAWTAA